MLILFEKKDLILDMHDFKEITPGKKSGIDIPTPIVAAMRKRGIYNLSQLSIAVGWGRSGRMKTGRMFTKSHAYLKSYIKLSAGLHWPLSEFSRVVTKMSRARAEEKIRERIYELYGNMHGLSKISKTWGVSLYGFFRAETDFQPLRDYQLISDVIGMDIDALVSELLGKQELTQIVESVKLDDVEGGHKRLMFRVA